PGKKPYPTYCLSFMGSTELTPYICRIVFVGEHYIIAFTLVLPLFDCCMLVGSEAASQASRLHL
ncbi:hypothetical protein, partial [Pandoraea sputorum]|uniref:hypothetical protein n=1 Tax=Pandoraea sputorum TaxID=93222 RepID=UPI003555C212